MLLQTNSYIVPKEKRTEHARLLARFRHTLAKLGCDQFECYEQTGTNWSQGESSNRFVQIMRFRDRKHQQQVQAAERTDPTAQALIKEFCELINFPYQQQQGYFAVGFYTSVLPVAALRVVPSEEPSPEAALPAPTEEVEPEHTKPEQSDPEQQPAPSDALQPDGDSEVATADFGEVLDIDKELGLADSEPQSASDDPQRQ
jgi:hypothetical protein